MWLLVDPRAEQAIGDSSPVACPWNVHSAHHSHSESRFQGRSLERA